MTSNRQVPLTKAGQVHGAVVVVDVLRAFSTAAYAFGSGAQAIYLVAEIAEAIAFQHENPAALIMGESGGLRPEGFDYPNSPAALRAADVDGRILVQRTSAGTQGVLGARSAERTWAGSLVCASATAEAVTSAGLGSPTYVISGRVDEAEVLRGEDDRLTADLIERARIGAPLLVDDTMAALHQTYEARRCLALSAADGDPLDVGLAACVDAFEFAMEAVSDVKGVRLVVRK